MAQARPKKHHRNIHALTEAMDAVNFVCCCTAASTPERVVHFTSGELAPGAVSDALRNAYTLGEANVAEFAKRLDSTDGVTIWDKRKMLNLQTWYVAKEKSVQREI